MRRDDLFTVVHDLFMTDTAREADIVLPATSQLEQVDLHKPYGHRNLQYNAAAIAPLGEAKSNWDVMRLLAAAMGYDEPWLRQSAEEVILEVVDATRATNPLLEGVTLERLQAEGTVPLNIASESSVPFADLRFPTPSGKVELRSEALAAQGLDSLPDYQEPAEFAARPAGDTRLTLISGAAHHFVSSSLANQRGLLAKEGEPYIELHVADAAARGISSGDLVEVASARGSCQLRAVVTDAVRQGVPSRRRDAGRGWARTGATSTGRPPTHSQTSPGRAPSTATSSRYGWSQVSERRQPLRWSWRTEAPHAR